MNARNLFSSKYPTHKVTDLKGYQWPASALTCNEMAKLTEARRITGAPITKLLRDAVAGQMLIPILKVRQI